MIRKVYEVFAWTVVIVTFIVNVAALEDDTFRGWGGGRSSLGDGGGHK